MPHPAVAENGGMDPADEPKPARGVEIAGISHPVPGDAAIIRYFIFPGDVRVFVIFFTDMFSGNNQLANFPLR